MDNHLNETSHLEFMLSEMLKIGVTDPGELRVGLHRELTLGRGDGQLATREAVRSMRRKISK